MSGRKCEFINCGKSKRNFPELVFHRFPKDAERSREWILRSGNASLAVLDEEKLRNRYLCDLHFNNDHDFKSPHRLTSDAVPKRYNDDEIHVLIPSKTYSRNKTCSNDKSQEQDQSLTTSPKSREWVRNLIDLPADLQGKSCKRKLLIESESLKETKLQKKLKLQSQTLKSKSLKIRNLNKTVYTLRTKNCLSSNVERHAFKTTEAKILNFVTRAHVSERMKQDGVSNVHMEAFAIYELLQKATTIDKNL
ncbi:hypothetical protein RN001_007886 [Aquatica leii]|uniref:THAP-type domain-containing protein n=1 Tax=Aquatica leii TaxID=1421715 RepID=A0AAN7Q4P2_9COLE|nr:hypothetical protein RN001_007886 [Aquatica leii]